MRLSLLDILSNTLHIGFYLMELFADIISGLGGGVFVIAAFIFALTIIVFCHEFGHFWVARRAGVIVDVFSVGFGPEICGFNDKKGTRWKLSWVPLGGYVKFRGDENAASTPDLEAIKNLPEEKRKGTLFFAPLGWRMAIVSAGPIANFILAFFIFLFIYFFVGQQKIAPNVGYLYPNMPAAEAGFKVGDKITAINGQSIFSFNDLIEKTLASKGKELKFSVLRSDSEINISASPILKGDRYVLGIVLNAYIVDAISKGSPAEKAGVKVGDIITKIGNNNILSGGRLSLSDELKNSDINKTVNIIVEREGKEVILPMELSKFSNDSNFTKKISNSNPGKVIYSIGEIGVAHISRVEVNYKKLGFIASITSSIERVWFFIKLTFKSLWKIIIGTESVKQLKGPVGITKIVGDAAATGFISLLTLIALLSVNIGFVNLFPIPVLDGGHLLYYIIEAIKGKPLSPKAQEFGYKIGFTVIMGLLLFTTYNDIIGW